MLVVDASKGDIGVRAFARIELDIAQEGHTESV